MISFKFHILCVYKLSILHIITNFVKLKTIQRSFKKVNETISILIQWRHWFSSLNKPGPATTGTWRCRCDREPRNPAFPWRSNLVFRIPNRPEGNPAVGKTPSRCLRPPRRSLPIRCTTVGTFRSSSIGRRPCQRPKYSRDQPC